MDTTEIIKNALDWSDKRLELTDQKLTEEQRNYITFALRQNLVNLLPIQNVVFLLPSHAELTKKALEVHGYDDNEKNMAKHKSWIDGGVWMLDECIKYLEGNET